MRVRRTQMDNLDLVVLVRAQPKTCEYVEIEILFGLTVRIFRGEHWIQFPDYILLELVVRPRWPQRLTQTQRTTFLLPPEPKIVEYAFDRLPAVEIRKSIACSPIDLTMCGKQNGRAAAQACMWPGRRRQRWRPSFRFTIYAARTLFTLTSAVLFSSGEFIFIAALRLIYLRFGRIET